MEYVTVNAFKEKWGFFLLISWFNYLIAMPFIVKGFLSVECFVLCFRKVVGFPIWCAVELYVVEIYASFCMCSLCICKITAAW